jgi:uncharacterized protein YcnI
VTYRQLIRLAALPAAVGLALLSGGVAAANVSVSPGEVTPGSTTVLDLRDAPTTKVEIKLPADQAFSTLAARPKIGWDTTLVRAAGATTGPVSSVVWTLTDDRFGIAPGAFDVFSLQVGPLPATGPLVFPTVQTYRNLVADVWSDAVVRMPVATAAPAPIPVATASPAAEAKAEAASETSKPDNRGRVTAGLAIGGVLIGLAVLGSPLYGRRSREAEEDLGGPAGPAEAPRLEV